MKTQQSKFQLIKKHFVTRYGSSMATSLCLLMVMLFFGFPANAMIIFTNCVDTGPSLAGPKRLSAGCFDLGLPDDFFSEGLTDPLNNGFVVQFESSDFYQGVGKVDGSGAFQWKVAPLDGWISTSDLDIHRFLAVQNIHVGADTVASLGLCTDTSGTLSPIFERQLPIGDYGRVLPVETANGTTIVSLDKTNSIILIGLSSNGQVMWTKELSSPEFPVVSVPDEPAHEVNSGRIGANNALLSISATEMVDGTNTAMLVLIRVDSAGTIQWAKKVQIPIFTTDENPFSSIWQLSPSGDTFTLYSVGEDLVDPTTGEQLGADVTKKGSVKVTSVQEKYAKAKSDAPIAGVKVGDIVKAQ